MEVKVKIFSKQEWCLYLFVVIQTAIEKMMLQISECFVVNWLEKMNSILMNQRKSVLTSQSNYPPSECRPCPSFSTSGIQVRLTSVLNPFRDTDLGSESPGAGDFNNLCRICGALGPKTCGGCKVARYCSKDHQALDWKSGHKAECKNPENISKVSCSGHAKFLFPEFEIELEPEELEAAKEKSEEEVMKDYEELLRSGQVTHQNDEDSDTENDLINMATQETDKQFQKFRMRIKDYPDQIVRYDRGHEPLWVSSSNKPADIPPCPSCGQPRQFEFQVMPQLLVHLKVDNPGKSIDWGTVLVYSCKESCQQDRNYIEELAYKQDYSPISQVMKNHPCAAAS
ncbi:programmed cell death protein 2 isoform X5 [Cherax quadricarinatus]|uniref:programmed cell death protein 2 isoform X5 n=1 Tax=Cherax quadricarinatus TaxID=27406 RepID=UPI00387E43D0